MSDQIFNRDSLKKEPFRIAFLGPSGMGKTTYMLTLLNTALKDHFTYVFCVSTLLNFSKQYSTHIWPDKYFAWDRLVNGESKDSKPIVYLVVYLEKILKFAQQVVQKSIMSPNKDKKPNFLIIFDDCDSLLRQSTTIGNLLTKCRHSEISVIALVQNITQTHSDWRAQFTHLFCFGGLPGAATLKKLSDFGIDQNVLKKIAYQTQLNPTSVGRKGSPLILTKGTSIEIFYDYSDQDVIEGKYKLDFLFNSRSRQKREIIKKLRGNKGDGPITLERLKSVIQALFLSN